MAVLVLIFIYERKFIIQNLDLENESGRSMIEMLGVLAIIGVLSVGGIAGYSKAMTKYRINKAIEQITLIAGNIRAFFAPQGDYEGLGDNNIGRSIIKKAKLVPDEMLEYNSDGDIRISNVFGKIVNLYTAHKSTSTDKQAFNIYYDIPKDYEICIELLSYDWTVASVTGIGFGQGPIIYRTVPVSIDDAVSACSSNVYPVLLFYFDVNSNCWNETNGNRCS